MNYVNRVLVALLFSLCVARAATNAQLVADLNPGPNGSFPSNFTTFSGSMYFSAYTLSTGRELWKYDGTNITLVADINPTKDDLGGGTMEGNDSLPSWLTVFNDQLYFSAYDPYRGAELWRHYGTTTERVADISPDQNDTVKLSPNSSWPAELTVLNGSLYFSANSGTAIPNYELWRYNGSTTSRVANIHPDIGTNYSSYPNSLFAFNGALYFMADDGAHGYELWKTDGTNTLLLSDINPGAETSSSFPKQFTPFNNDLYFVANRDDIGYELWKTDGTNVTLVTDINPGATSSYPDYLTVFNGALYFRAGDADHGSELFKTDGTTTSLVADINPAGDSFPKNLTVFGSQLVFAADDGVHGWELWRSDGQTTELVTDLNTAGDAFPENFLVFSNALYFTATTPDTGYELWKYDGTNVTLAADINPGAGDSFPQFLSPFDGSIYFRAAGDGATNWEVWKYAPEATVVITPTAPTNLTIQIVGSQVDLTWQTTAGTTNIVEAATDITGPWSEASAAIIPAGAGQVTAQFTEPFSATAATRFYRIKAQ